MPENDPLVPIGKITGTHGIRGALKFHSYSGNLDTLQKAKELILKSKTGELKKIVIESATEHGNRLILRFCGYDDINKALPFVGREICLNRNLFPEPEEDEYYWCDIIGLEVVTDHGVSVGRVSDIFEAGSCDIYVVQSGNREHLIPSIAKVIKEIDIDSGKIVITPLEGLLDP